MWGWEVFSGERLLYPRGRGICQEFRLVALRIWFYLCSGDSVVQGLVLSWSVTHTDLPVCQGVCERK